MSDRDIPLPSGMSVRDVLRWDSGTWSRAVRFWLDTSRVPLEGARVLEVGAGPGGLSFYLAALGANVTCTDTSISTTVRQDEERFSFASRITYRSLDITRWPDDLGRFDVIVARSVTGGLGTSSLDTPRRAIASMIGALNPGGEYWFADNLRGSPLHRLFRRMFVPRRVLWHYYRDVDELQSLMPPDIETTIVELGLLGVLGRTEDQRVALSRLEQRFHLESLLPSRWRYVAAGIARPTAAKARTQTPDAS